MSMDASAIAHIQETTQATEAHQTLQELGGVPAIVVPKTHEVKDVEYLQLHRSRFRGSFKTTSLNDFTAYFINNASKNCSGLYIQADSMTAKAIFNLYTEHNNHPGHGDHTATLAMVETAAYKALQQIDGKQLSQKTLSEWMEDWRANLIAHSDMDEELPIAGAINAVRKITIEALAKRDTEVKSFGASQSAMESIEAKSQNPLPAFLHFSCTPYIDLPGRTFVLRVGILTGEREPKLIARIIKLEDHQEAMAEEFKALIIKSLPKDQAVYLGQLSL